MPSESKKTFDHLAGLHEKYCRHDLRGMWQRDAGGAPQLQPRLWSWKEIGPILEESLKTVRLPEDTDQRVIGLSAPGSTNRAIWMAYQLLNPGEQVASHRHTPAQMRFIVQGTGAYTTAEGERMFMEPGDLLVQPNWTWHGTANVGEGPILWLDIQDRNLVNYLGAFMRDLWPGDEVQPMTRAEGYHSRLFDSFRLTQASGSLSVQPPFRYKWTDTLKRLDDLTETAEANPYDGILFDYANPVTGRSTSPTMSAQIQVLKAFLKTGEHRHTGMTMYHVVKGQGATTINGTLLEWHERDCFFVPPLLWHAHENRSRTDRAILFTVSDRPVLEALGLYREEGR
jgi:gentisate 1,2-dioxygenase